LASRRCRRSSAAMARRSLVFILRSGPPTKLGSHRPRSLGVARRDALGWSPCRSSARFFVYRKEAECGATHTRRSDGPC
jgi:hypothetical protein